MILYIAIGLVSVVTLILIIGILLPAERVVSRKGHFDTTPQVLYEIVTGNQDWRYRSSLKELVILESKGGMELWEEISHDGSVIRFETKEKRPFSFYSFDMTAKLFNGYWSGEFQPNGKGGTIFTATEHIRVKNPFIKTLSYLFFDVGGLMDKYQQDLHKKVNTIKQKK